MGKLIFITGGSKSGKSSLAVSLAKRIPKEKVFIATCIPKDSEMKRRVALHKRNRPSSWKTIEVRDSLVSIVRKEAQSDMVIIIDCLTLFISLFLIQKAGENRIKNEVDKAVRIIKNGKAAGIIVSNEVGCGLVPENKLGRDFRDIAGVCNQIVAKGADEVIYMVSGIPLTIKGAKQWKE